MDNLDYITADLESPLAMMKMDITTIPFEDNSVDVILCNHLLEHVEDDRKAMKEMYRVLKEDGWAIIQPHIDMKREEYFGGCECHGAGRKRKTFQSKRSCKSRWIGLCNSARRSRIYRKC